MATRAARSLAAATATGLCRAAGLRVSIAEATGGWAVRSPTGRTTVAATLTEVWTAVAAQAGTFRVPEPAQGPCPPGAPPLPAVPQRRVALLLDGAPTPEAWDGGWAGEVVGPAALEEVLDGAGERRVLVVCSGVEQLREVLTRATGASLRERCAVTALVRRGAGPPWLDDVTALPAQDLHALLDGRCDPVGVARADLTRRHLAQLPAVACWVAAVLASGALAERRLRAVVGAGDERVVLDAAAGRGLGVRRG